MAEGKNGMQGKYAIQARSLAVLSVLVDNGGKMNMTAIHERAAILPGWDAEMVCHKPDQSKCPSYTAASLGASELKSNGWVTHAPRKGWAAVSPLPIEAQVALDAFMLGVAAERQVKLAHNDTTEGKQPVIAGGERVITVIGYETLTDEQKRDMFILQSGNCYICGIHMGEWLDAEIDHIQARSEGGDCSISGGNIALAHAFCNRTKGNGQLADARIRVAEKRERVDLLAAIKAEAAAKRWIPA